MNSGAVVIVTFLICTALLSAAAHGKPLRQQLRCRCVRTYSGKPIHVNRIQKLKVIPAGPHCKTLEIIATMKNGQNCLNPNSEWVKSLTEELTEIRTESIKRLFKEH